MADTLTDPVATIQNEVATVQAASADGASVTARPIPDSIAGLLFAAQAQAAGNANGLFGIRASKGILPGPFPRCGFGPWG